MKENEYKEALLHFYGMNIHYLKFIEESIETDPIRIEFKNDLIEIIKNHRSKYEHFLPKEKTE